MLLIKNTPIFPLGVILVAVCFFKPVIFPEFMFFTGARLLLFIFAVILFATHGRYKWKDMPYKKLFVLYLLFIALNVFSCWYFREQSCWITMKCWSPFLLVFLMPTFKSWKLSSERWERILLILFIIYMACNYLQYIFIHTQLFYLMKEFDRMETKARAVLFGEGILSLGSLMCLNRFLLNKKKLYIILYIFSSFLLLLHGFRMMLLGFSIASFYLIYKMTGLSRKMFAAIIVGLIIAVGLFQLPIVQDKIEEMELRAKDSSLNNENYVRILGWNYFTKNHFKNEVERFLGSGQTIIYNKGDQMTGKPVTYLSKYSRMRSDLVYYHYIWSVDWGIFGLSWDGGIFFAATLILILFFMFRQKVKVEHFYINSWALMLILISVTKPLCYSQNVFIYYAVLLTLIDIDITSRKRELLI